MASCSLPRSLPRSWRQALLLPLLAGGCSNIAAPTDDAASGSHTSANTGTGDSGPGTTSGSGSSADSTGESTGGSNPGETDGGTTGPPPGDDSGLSTDGTTGGAECDDQTPVALVVPPDDTNAMSSPVQVREAALRGPGLTSSIPIRNFEFFNYYNFPYPPAAAGTVAVKAAVFQGPDDPENEFVLQVGISSESISNADRPPLNVTLVLDTSGSMSGDALGRLRDVSRAVAASLLAGDRISMVTWTPDQVPMLAGFEVTGPNDPTVVAKIEMLDATGGADLTAGLEAGYNLANQVWDPLRVNRLLLVSDGGVEPTTAELEVISANADVDGGEGILLVGVGVGSPDTYNQSMMDHATDAGRGPSVFIASEDEAWLVFNERFVNTMLVAARDLRLELELPPGFVLLQPNNEPEDADPSPAAVQDLAANDSLVFHRRIRTCAPELVDSSSELTVTVTYDAPAGFTGSQATDTATFATSLYASDAALHKGRAVFSYAEGLKAYKRAATPADKDSIIAETLARVSEAAGFLPEDPDLAEITLVLKSL